MKRYLNQMSSDQRKITKKHHVQKIISGGQTGCDMGALLAAEELGIKTGGAAARDFMAVDGKHPELGAMFHLVELPFSPNTNVSAMYVARSKKNVDDSDGTIAFRLFMSFGTDKTIGYAVTGKWITPHHLSVYGSNPKTNYKPILIIRDISPSNHQPNMEAIIKFINDNNI